MIWEVELRRPWGFSPEARRGSQGASRAAPGKSGLHARGEGAKYIMQNARLDEAQARIKIARRNINNLRYADDTTLMAESEEELKSFVLKGFPPFPVHLRMRPVSRGNSRRATWVGPQAERPRFPGPLLRRTRGPDPSSKATLWVTRTGSRGCMSPRAP